jgi:hypothetical protein
MQIVPSHDLAGFDGIPHLIPASALDAVKQAH